MTLIGCGISKRKKEDRGRYTVGRKSEVGEVIRLLKGKSWTRSPASWE